MSRAARVFGSIAAVSLFAGLPACAPGDPDAIEEHAEEAEGALGEARITFGADFSETVSGKLRAGDPIEIAFDASRLSTCRGEQGGVPQWAITAHYRVNGGSVHAITVAGLMAESPALIVPESAGTLEIWFSITNKWGCHAYDSNFGENYRFQLAAPVGQPGWVGNAASVINRWTCEGGPCDQHRTGLGQGFVFDTWARQRATVAGLYSDVWEEGVSAFAHAAL